MLAQQKAAEPSMEEILASIRRIIADDDALPLTPRLGPRLVDVPASPAPAAPVLTLVAPDAVHQHHDFEVQYAEAGPGVYAAPQEYHAAAPLVSPDTSMAVHASFETLAATVMAQNSAMIEENIRSMLRPLLKSWLDDNLPVIVEKLVRAEIERVARGGR